MKIRHLTLIMSLLIGRAGFAQQSVALSPDAMHRFVAGSGGRMRLEGKLTDPSRLKSRDEREALADTIMAIAIAEDGQPVPGLSAANVIHLLAVNARGPATTRLFSATRRLQTIADQAADVGVRAAATLAMGMLPDTAGSVRALVEIARSSNLAAYVAVTALASSRGSAGIAALRTLYTEHLVQTREARTTMNYWAVKFGWRQLDGRGYRLRQKPD